MMLQYLKEDQARSSGVAQHGSIIYSMLPHHTEVDTHQWHFAANLIDRA